MSILFEPVRVGPLAIKNRFVRSATYYGLADKKGFVGNASVDLMKKLAENEIGLIVTGYAYVQKSGQVVADMNGIQSDDHIPGYQKMTRAVHERDGKIMLQIVHGGSAAYSASFWDNGYMAVSVLEDMPRYGATAREMNDEDIEGIVEAFGQAGRRAQESGFDGVQIHGAHGYLVSQFLSPLTNRRTDRWGGSLENRMRFVVEVVRAIRRCVDDDYPVAIKLGCRDFFDDGSGLTIEEGAEVAGTLEGEGLCFLEISNGFPFEQTIPLGIKASKSEASYLPEARVIRERTSGPLCLVAGMRSLPVMEEIVREGAADLIALCRPLIREPGLIRRWISGDTRPSECISCGGCFNYLGRGRHIIACRKIHKALIRQAVRPII